MPRILIEKILTLKDQLVPVSFLSSDLLYIPTITVLILLVLTFALVLYVISLRIAFNANQKSKKRQFQIWENLVLTYLSGEASEEEIARAVRTKHFGLFSEFMEKYLETLRGEDFGKLTYLLKKIGLITGLVSSKMTHNYITRIYPYVLLPLVAVPWGALHSTYSLSFSDVQGIKIFVNTWETL